MRPIIIIINIDRMEEGVPLIGYWKLRGLVELARLILEFGSKPYKMEWYKNGPPPEHNPSEWTEKKFNLGLEFPNLPYLVDGELRMTESFAIYLYLMNKYVPELLGKTEQIKVKVMEGLSVLVSIKKARCLLQ